MLGVRERTEAEQDDCERLRQRAHVVPGLHVVDDPRHRLVQDHEPGRTTKPTAAWIAPSTVREPSVTTSTTQTRPWNGDEVRRRSSTGLLVHREQPAAEAGDPGRERERDDARPASR